MQAYQKHRTIIFAAFLLLMMTLGVSDSLRGVFSGVFGAHFGVSTSMLGQMVTVSYAGNLLFLLLGGRLMDRFQRKRVMLCVLLIWMGALLLFLVTDSYLCILVGMFFLLGASTLLSTTLNITTPLLFAASPALAVNFLFFVQGIGTSGSQSVIGNLAESFSHWKWVVVVLLVVGTLSFVLLLLFFPGMSPEEDGRRTVPKEERSSFATVMRHRAFVPFVLLFAFYFIAEHGIMNWMILYGVEGLLVPKSSAANTLALFYGGITIGRLLFGTVLDRFGFVRSLCWFSAGGTLLFVAGILLGSGGLLLLGVSGFLLSVLYPSLVMLTARLWGMGAASSASGLLISLASLGDILFNALFGGLIEGVGYRSAFLVLPAAMVAFLVVLLTARRRLTPQSPESAAPLK